jgi:peptidoglycan/LPS O-acetylase OafA/YrhL
MVMIAHRFNTLDGIRGVAALAVMFLHLTSHTSTKLFPNAAFAVDLFFCLSGFVIAYSYQEKLQTSLSFRVFIFRRLVRLYPMFFVGLTLGAISLFAKIISTQTSFTVNEAISAILLNAFYFPYLSEFYIQVGNDRIEGAIFPTNDPAWSLFFELIVNVTFASYVFQNKKKHPWLLVIVAAVAISGFARITGINAPGWGGGINILGGFPRTVFGFYSGVLIFSLYGQIRKYLPTLPPVLLVLTPVAIFSIPTLPIGYLVWLTSTLFIVPLLVAAGAVSVSRNDSLTKIFDYLGWLSYPIYCVHFPIYSIFTVLSNNADMGLLGAILCAAISIVVAHIFGKYIDEPFRNWFSSFANQLKFKRI